MRILRVLPFTIVGVFTIALFLLLESLDPGTRGQSVWPALMQLERLLIIPIWLMRGVVVRAGIDLFGPDGGFPGWFDVATIPILLIPHFAFDLLLFFVGRAPARPAAL